MVFIMMQENSQTVGYSEFCCKVKWMYGSCMWTQCNNNKHIVLDSDTNLQ